MDYTIRILRKCKEYGFKVYMDPHQDIVSVYSTTYRSFFYLTTETPSFMTRFSPIRSSHTPRIALLISGPSPLTSLVDLFNPSPPFAFKTMLFSSFSGLGIAVALEHLTGRFPPAE